MKDTGWNDLTRVIGSPTILCINCNKGYGTGRKYWEDMDGFDRLGVYSRLTFGCILGGLMGAFFVALIITLISMPFGLHKTEFTPTTEKIFFTTCLILGYAWNFWGHFSEFQELKSKKKKHDSHNELFANMPEPVKKQMRIMRQLGDDDL